MNRVVVSDHAQFEAARRQVTEEEIRQVALGPEQVISSRKGRVIHQSRIDDSRSGERLLLRVVIEKRRDVLFVVTVYKTSKVEKYWQPEVEP